MSRVYETIEDFGVKRPPASQGDIYCYECRDVVVGGRSNLGGGPENDAVGGPKIDATIQVHTQGTPNGSIKAAGR